MLTYYFSECVLFPSKPRKANDLTVSIFARAPILRVLFFLSKDIICHLLNILASQLGMCQQFQFDYVEMYSESTRHQALCWVRVTGVSTHHVAKGTGAHAQQWAPGHCHTEEGRLPLEVGSGKLTAEGRCTCGQNLEAAGCSGI